MPQITMIEDAWDGATLLARESSPVVTIELADQLISAGKAVDTFGYRRERVFMSDYERGIGVPVSPRLAGQLAQLISARNPFNMPIYADSTGDEKSEWPYLLLQLITADIGKTFATAYRAWSDTRQQYATIEYLSTGSEGRRYISAGQAATSHRIEVTCDPVTGDFTAILECDLMGGGPASQFAMCAAYGGAGSRGWRWELQAGNTMFFEWSTTGTDQIPRTSSAIPSEVLNGGRVFLRVQLDVDNGASGHTCTFAFSYNRTTWTTIGSPIVQSGLTSIFATSTTLQLIGRGGGSITSLGKNFRFYGLELFASLDETNLRAQIDCGSVPQRSSMTSIAYVDDCGNAGTIYFQGSTVAGSPRFCMNNGSVGGQVIAYAVDSAGSNARFRKLTGGYPNVPYISYSHNEGADVTYRADLKALTDLLVAMSPDVAPVYVGQNRRWPPASGIAEHGIRLEQAAEFMLAQGFDVFDMSRLVMESELKSDKIHPDPATGVMARVARGMYSQLKKAAYGVV